MANERNTEILVRDHFKNDPLFNIIKWEEQKSMNKRVLELLAGASKWWKGIGKPEFLITFPQGNMDYLIVIECKASLKDHTAKDGNGDPSKYAVEGALHYAERLKEEYDVIAIAVSGETESELLVNNFHWKKGAKSWEKLADTTLLGVNDYLRIFANEQFAENLKNIDIIKKAIELNDEYQAYSITELTRCTMVSAILLALTNDTFRTSYPTYSDSSDIAKALLSSIETVLKKQEVRNRDSMIGEYSKIANEPLFTQAEVKHTKKKEREKSVEVVKEMIRYLHKNVYPLTQMEQSGLDVLGRFYTEFIRYAGGEGGQGLVLTPAHITDLFCDLANVDKNSIVYDPCCGSGGFLISAMKRMLADAGGDEAKKQEIRKNQLIGVELRPSMFTYACSNMMMRGDGKSNIYCGDCFPFEDIIKNEHKPTVAFLNPPYDVGSAGQLHFIEHALNTVAPQNGWVVAIVQMSVGIKNEKDLIAAKTRVLQKHRLHAVLSMPDELFDPSAVVATSIMVFKAGEKHEGRKTWFGYFKDDGFEKRKHKGRIDARGKWKAIKKQWVDAYHNLDEVSGLSVKAEVGPTDEWCAEAYMETGYSGVKDEDFIKKALEYISFRVVNKDFSFMQEILNKKHPKLSLDVKKWKYFEIADLFEIIASKDKNLVDAESGKTPYISSSAVNNGLHSYIDVEPSQEWNTITVARIGSVWATFYHGYEYAVSSDNVRVLKPKFHLNKFMGIFLATLIEREKYRYAYGRTFSMTRMKQTKIKLPSTLSWNPDWQWIEDYVKWLDYSANL